MQPILKRPLITEKSLTLAKGGWYTFVVENRALKSQIAASVAREYKVKVLEVRTISLTGKTKRTGRLRQLIKKSDWKKAIVRLKKGDHIDVFETATEAKQ